MKSRFLKAVLNIYASYNFMMEKFQTIFYPYGPRTILYLYWSSPTQYTCSTIFLFVTEDIYLRTQYCTRPAPSFHFKISFCKYHIVSTIFLIQMSSIELIFIIFQKSSLPDRKRKQKKAYILLLKLESTFRLDCHKAAILKSNLRIIFRCVLLSNRI